MRTNTEQSHTQRGLCLLILLLAVFLTANTAFLPVVSYADTATDRFTVTGEAYPTTLQAGNSYSIKGTITGVNAITRVEIGVVDAAGSYVSGFHFDQSGLNTQTYNIANADSSLKFGNLPAGSYYYRVTAYDAQGAQELINAAFTVTKPQPVDTGKRGWKYEGGQWHYYRSNGTLFTNGWVKDSHGWCYAGSDGNLVKSSWAKDSHGYCWMNSSGYWYTTKGWIRIGGEWYYINGSGYRAANSWLKDRTGWCYAGSDGRLIKNGWAQDRSGWCWLNGSGYWKLSAGWIKSDGEWYYIKSNGYRAVNTWAQDSVGWCWMDGNGRIAKSRWIKADGAWYYLKSNGYRAANAWAKDSVGWCWMDGNGRITTAKWIKYKNEWYYLKANGYMAANEWAKDSKGWMWMNADGKITRSQTIEYDGKTYTLSASGYSNADPTVASPELMIGKILPYDAALIAAIGKQPYSGPCGTYSMAYGRAVIDGKLDKGSYKTYKDFIIGYYGMGGSYAYWNRAGGSMIKYSTDTSMYKGAFNQIAAGKPCIINCYNPPTGNNHFVLAIGYVAGTTKSNVTLDSFIVLDPATGTQRFMSDTSYVTPARSPYGPELIVF